MNIGGGEVLVILLVALIVLGPTKLPEAARQVGKAVNEFRRISSGFQRELQEAMDDATVEPAARERGAAHVAPEPPPTDLGDLTRAPGDDDTPSAPPGDPDAPPAGAASNGHAPEGSAAADDARIADTDERPGA